MNKFSTYIEILGRGGIGIVPTDTLYGIIGRAGHRATVEKIYRLKGRDNDKPLIILIADISQVADFGITLNDYQIEYARQKWPGPNTLIFHMDKDVDGQYEYLHRGRRSLGFRIPDNQIIIDLVTESGPLVAPSANPQGEEPAQTIVQAREYFGDAIDFYHDGGEVTGNPSNIFEVLENSYRQLR